MHIKKNYTLGKEILHRLSTFIFYGLFIFFCFSSGRGNISATEVFKQKESGLSPMRIENLDVPIFDKNLILKYAAGVRPIHTVRPQIGAKIISHEEKPHVIAECWGHGGAGITLAPGSARMVWDKIKEVSANPAGHTGEKKINPFTDNIAIGGAGIIGLWTAYHLVKEGVPGSHITVYADNFDNTTSHMAAGMWLPISMPRGGDDPTFFTALDDDSYKAYKELAEDKQPVIKGVKELPLYTFNMHAEAQRLADRRLVPQGEVIIIKTQFGKTLEAMKWEKGFFLVDPFVHMPSLKEHLTQEKVNFISHKFNNAQEFFQPGLPIFINCLGLGNKALFAEGEGANLRPSKGELVYLKPQANIDHMLFGVLPSGRTFGYIPKADGLVIGVTRKPGDDSLAPVPEHAQELIEFGQNLLGFPNQAF